MADWRPWIRGTAVVTKSIMVELESESFGSMIKRVAGTSCRERNDDWQNCNSCPDTSCCDNTNPELKKE